MKIEPGKQSTLMPLETQLHKVTPAGPLPPVKPADEPFSVELSSASERIGAPQSPDEISHDRVAAIRDQLASGTYNLSGKDVANKILGVLKG